MAPIGTRRSCVVCGKFPKDKKAKPLVHQDAFWKQHADDIRTGSEVPLKEFLKYFGISLDSVVASAKAEDVDQVSEELVICGDCNDWVLYGAFLKEKFHWVERVLRDKIRNAFIAGRLQYRNKSSVDHVAVIVEQVRQCLMPCCVVVDRDSVPDDLNLRTEPAANRSVAESPPAKRRRTRALGEEPLLLANWESIAPTADDSTPASMDGGAEDTLIDYADLFDGTEALDGISHDGMDDFEPSGNEFEVEDTTAVMNNNERKVGQKGKASRKNRQPKARTSNNKVALNLVPLTGVEKVIAPKECPVCLEKVSNYIDHMILTHRIQPHHTLLNNFWCRGCKMAYQPPDPQTPTGQYLEEHRNEFLEFVQVHSVCTSSDGKPIKCRFCNVVLQRQRRSARNCIEHEAIFHPEKFIVDSALAENTVETRRAAKREKYQRRKANKVQNASMLSRPSGTVLPIRKTCLICNIAQEDYREHMTEHNLITHPIFLDFYCCRTCKQAYQPPDPDTPTGKYLLKDHELFLKFMETHKDCSYTEDWPPHTCRYCQQVQISFKNAAIACIDHEISTHPEKVGELANLVREGARVQKMFMPFKSNPGNCPVCNLEVTAYGLHMISEHNLLPHHIHTNFFICRHCKLPYEPPDPRAPIGRYQREDHESFLQFISAHSSCIKQTNQPVAECRFCEERFSSPSDPFDLIIHQLKVHSELIGRKPNRPIPKSIVRKLPAAGVRHKPRKQIHCVGDNEIGNEPPVVLMNEIKGEVIVDEQNFTEDPLMMDDFMALDHFDTTDPSQEDDINNIDMSTKIVPPETSRTHEEMSQQPETLGLQLNPSGVRRSTRPKKTMVTLPVNDSSSSASEAEEDSDIGELGGDKDQSVLDIDSSASESEECLEEIEAEGSPTKANKAPKRRIRIRKKEKKKYWHPKPLELSDENDDDESDDGSEKISCVVCDAQRSRPKLQNHYKVKHNLLTPYDGYFGCRGCQHAYLSPNENLPTGKFVPEDIDHLREFVSDHDGCRQLYIEKLTWSPGDSLQLHFCRYCFKRFHQSASMTECIEHEKTNHENCNTEKDSCGDANSVFSFFCVYCKLKTESLADVYMHMRSHRKPHRFGCCKCDSQFKDIRELTYHIRLHGTSNDVFDSCVLCDAYMDAPSIVGHYQQYHCLEMVNYKYFGCWYCEEAFVSEHSERSSGTVFEDDLENLKNFVVRHGNCKVTRQHPAKEQKCRKCPSTFTTMKQLVEHEENKHSEDRFVPDFCCGTCNKTFLSEEGLQKHLVLHLPEEFGFKADVPFHDCPDCYFSCEIYSKCDFDRHRLLHQPDKAEKERQFREVSVMQFLRRPVESYTGVCHICDNTARGKPKIFKKVAAHYRRHNLVEYYNQLCCAGCKEILVDDDGVPQLIGMHKPTQGVIKQLRHFAANHKNCLEVPDKPIKCIKCDTTKKNVFRYLDHYAVHRNSPERSSVFSRLHCLRCGETFHSIVQLRDHLKEKVQAWKCNGCKQQFMTKERYAVHSCSAGAVNPEPEIASDPPPYLTFRTGGLNCLTCVKCFDTVTEFNLHFKCCHNNADAEVKFECSVCHEVQTSTGDPESEDFPRICADHETKCKAKSREDGSKKCEDFSWPELTCYICQEGFESIQKYSAHINEHIGNSADVFCPVCPAVFTEAEERNLHIKLHGLKTSRLFHSYFSCILQNCLWISERPDAESGKLYPEDLSEFQVFAESHVNCHRPRFKDFKCKFCDFKFHSTTTLFNHEPQHTKGWLAYCEECGRGYSSQLRLKLHMKLHQEKFRFVCNLCPKTFKHRPEMEQHMNVHTGARPFICDQCGKGFTMRKRLREHVLYVHKKPTEKKSPCTWEGCDRMFATRREARVHELKAHNRPLETRRKNQFRDFGE